MFCQKAHLFLKLTSLRLLCINAAYIPDPAFFYAIGTRLLTGRLKHLALDFWHINSFTNQVILVHLWLRWIENFCKVRLIRLLIAGSLDEWSIGQFRVVSTRVLFMRRLRIKRDFDNWL